MVGEVGGADASFGGRIPDVIGGAGDAVSEVVEEGGGCGAVAPEGGGVHDEAGRADITLFGGGVPDSGGVAGDAVAEVVEVGG